MKLLRQNNIVYTIIDKEYNECHYKSLSNKLIEYAIKLYSMQLNFEMYIPYKNKYVLLQVDNTNNHPKAYFKVVNKMDENYSINPTNKKTEHTLMYGFDLRLNNRYENVIKKFTFELLKIKQILI